MNGSKSDPFDLQNLRMPAEEVERLAAVPRKIQKRRQQFTMLPMAWVEKLANSPGKTWYLAAHLTYRHWEGKGAPIKLANGMLEYDGISRQTKWRALRKLERLGLITINTHRGKSPIITVHA
jgi:hypothetical protein